MGSPPTGLPNAGGVGKVVFFDPLRSLPLRHLTTENLCASTMVVCIHESVEECSVVNNFVVVLEVC